MLSSRWRVPCGLPKKWILLSQLVPSDMHVGGLGSTFSLPALVGASAKSLLVRGSKSSIPAVQSSILGIARSVAQRRRAPKPPRFSQSIKLSKTRPPAHMCVLACACFQCVYMHTCIDIYNYMSRTPDSSEFGSSPCGMTLALAVGAAEVTLTTCSASAARAAAATSTGGPAARCGSPSLSGNMQP
jgi:hypothetical protein